MRKSDAFLVWIGCAALACGHELDGLEDGHPGRAEQHNKNATLTLHIPDNCQAACTISVSGVAYQYTAGVAYFANDVSIGTSMNWWRDYDITLPATLQGSLLITAQVLDTDGTILQSATSQERLGQGDVTAEIGNNEDSRTTVSLSTQDACVNPCELAANVSGDAYEVAFYADGFLLGKARQSDDFSISYRFSNLGSRQISAHALDEFGNVLGTDTAVIQVDNGRPNGSTGRPEVPFFYQYDNALHPGSSCQNTSVAMVLAYIGWTGAPDDLTASYGKNYAQSPAGLADLFNIYARRMGAPERLTPITNGTIAGLKSELDAGYPVIIHGYFTGPGHVLVVLGYDANGYYVNDPAGVWNQRFKGGYGYNRGGQDVYYSKSAFETAIATSNGYRQLPLWYHSLR